jgi:ATP-dependent helicase/nuclease subunit A
MSEAATQTPLSETTLLQNAASSPGMSVWVSANAGSGKTHVLTQRVIRLMLNGTRPSAILCLTYTKAAASEMSNRVFEKLSRWTALDDAQLAHDIATMEGDAPGPLKLAEARKLFARALESPGGLKIQTIHAFCESLLHQFPLEANVAGHFSVLDDKAAASLLSEARRLLLTATQAEGDEALARAFYETLSIGDESGLDRLLGDLIRNRTAVRRFLAASRDRGGYEAVLAEALGLEPGATVASTAARAWPLAGFSTGDVRAYIDLANDKGGSKAQACAYALGLAAREEDPVKRLVILREGLLKATDEAPYAESTYSNKDMRNRDAALIDRLIGATGWLARIWQNYKTARLYGATLSALILGERLIDNYEVLKKERSFLDFEDFITRTEALLKKEGIGPWVHYKLDQGIDHILVDEAQDTSPTQWEIIRSLTEDFFAGESARALNRTIFVVGDEKQSIYSFQGARPERFAEERSLTKRRAEDGERAFRPINLHVSFRSTEDVLTAVDRVFSEPANARGLSALGDPVVHVSNRIGQAGRVDLWETIAEETSADEDDDWLAPFDRVAERSAAAELARRVAASIEAMAGKQTVVERDGSVRVIRPGDILVLVRKRDAFALTLSRELKKGGRVAVAGADRLVLSSHIAIQDLMALGRFLILTEDDLSLAALIKSPLIHHDEEALYELAAERSPAESLWQRLNALAETSPRWRMVRDRLEGWRKLACSLRPHDFYARLLGSEGARRLFLARFGAEVSDVLDEFLSFALDHEQAGLPGLATFLATMEEDSPEIKREQDKGRDEVRIMTVHASKGLEAPVVFLVDNGGKPFDKTLLPRMRIVERGAGAASLPLWYPNKEFQCPVITADETRLGASAEEEYRRLLYVGMTRASDRLVLASYRKKRENAGTWAEIVRTALTPDERHCRPETFRAGALEWRGWTWRKHIGGEAEAPAAGEKAETRSFAPSTPPADLYMPLPPLADLPRPLAPSGAHAVIDETAGDEVVTSLLFDPKRSGSGAQARGKIMHRLLQTLPEFDEMERVEAAERYLSRAAPDWSEAERMRIAVQALDILDDPELAFLHHADTKAEVSIMGQISLSDRAFAVSGRIDRMGRDDKGVFILDYKTNLSPPERREEIPFAHRAQLALYRTVLESIFPGEIIRCLLLYTEGPQLYSLTEAEVEKALLDISAR